MAWLRRPSAFAAAVAVGAALFVAVAPSFAATPVVKAGVASVDVGSRAAVPVDALAFPDPGMGGWTIDVTFDPTVAVAVSCTPSSDGKNVCDHAYNERTARITGAAPDGLSGSNTLASITFECKTEGSSVLTVALVELADSAASTPTPLKAATSNGAIACAAAENGTVQAGVAATAPTSESFPTAGGGPIDWGAWGPFAWPIAGLAGAGVAWIAAGLLGMARLAGEGPRAPVPQGPPRVPRRERPPPVAPRTGARVTTPVTVRVKQIGDFSGFVNALGMLAKLDGVIDAQAVRYLDGEGVFDITITLPLTPTALLRVAEEGLARPVRFSGV